MIRCAMLLCVLVTVPSLADVVPEPPDQTGTAPPDRRAIVGRWQRVDTAYEQEKLVVSRDGRVTFGESSGRWTALSTDTIQLDFPNVSGFSRRLKCRWQLADTLLTLEIVESMSQGSAGDDYQVLDMDRSVQGETWRFKRGR